MEGNKKPFGGYGGSWDMPNCFGQPVCSTLPECHKCVFYGSCSFCLNNPLDEDTRYSTRREKWRRHDSVSFEAMGNTLETALAIDPSGIVDEEIDKPEFSRRELMSLLRSLLTDMDIGGLSLAVFALHKSGVNTNAKLADSIGCTRQNTHKKMLAAARADDRLRSLLTAVFFRFGKMVHSFDRKRKLT